MIELDPGDYNIGDIVRVAFTDKSATLDNLAKADIVSEPAIDQQVRKPTDNEQAEIEKIATEAAELQDELKKVVGDKQRRLKSLRDQLKEKMIHHGLNEVTISGRPPIELASSSSRKPTRKAIISVLQEQLGKKEGKMKALNLWNAIEPTTSQKITIPDPAPPEMDSPY